MQNKQKIGKQVINPTLPQLEPTHQQRDLKNPNTNAQKQQDLQGFEEARHKHHKRHTIINKGVNLNGNNLKVIDKKPGFS